MNTIVYAVGFGSVSLLLLTTLATPRKVNVYANYWLALFLFSFACILLDHALFSTQAYRKYPSIQGLLEITRLAMAPALYFSVLYFTSPDRPRKRSDYLHFVPFTLFLLFLITVFTGVNNSPIFSWFYNLPEGFRRGFAIIIFVSVKLQLITYWLLSYWLLTKHMKNIKTFSSTTDPVSLWWLRYFLLGLAAALLLSLNETVGLIPALVPVTHFGYLVLVFYLAYFSMRQQEIFPYQPKDVAEIHEIINESQPAKRFSDEELSDLRSKLQDFMAKEKVFLDPNLGLPQLASRVRLSTHDLSYLINEGFNENFFQFINRYRVDEAKLLLRSERHKHLSILGIAYESGFRSKSTFNATFKKITGMSPSEFMHMPERKGEKAA